MSTRRSKGWRDLAARRGRVLLTILALAAGVFELGAMLDAYALLRPELGAMYGRTHPASAILAVDVAGDALVDSVRRVPGVGAAEARPVVFARVLTGRDEWTPAVFSVVRDFRRQQLDTLDPERGVWPPGDGDVLLERTALEVAHARIGDTLTVRIVGSEDRHLRIAGTVHAAGLPPAWMEHMVPGFVGWSSALRSDQESAQIRIVVAENGLDEGHIHEVADSVRAMLERSGHLVTRVTVPPPGRHPHAAQMEAFLFLLLAFGILGFVLSTILVAAVVHEQMTEQLREIGIMKAIGASTRQIATLYLGQVLVLAVAALALGVPAGYAVGRAYAQFSAGILNTDIAGSPFPTGVVVLQIVAGLLLPALVALVPLVTAARIPVRQALADAPGAATGARAAWSNAVPLSRPLRLSLQAALARPGRLALTLGMLGTGGAAFMSALNVSAAWTRAVDADFGSRRYDLGLGLARPYSVDSLAGAFSSVPGITRAEYWPGASAYLLRAGGVAGSPLALLGVPPGSRLLALPLMSGRWLASDERRGAVLNEGAVALDSTLRVGGTVVLRVEGRRLELPIVGVVRELTPMAVVYTADSVVNAITGRSPGHARSVRLVTRTHDDAGQRAVAAELERVLADRGIEVAGMQRMRDLRQGILDHLRIIVSVLTIAALLVIVVGALGLISTLTLEVVRRTREFGIMAAIGARPRTILAHVWIESVAMGVASWLVALVLAVPASALLERACGRIFFQIPLAFTFAPSGAAIWLVLVVLLSTICSLQPARRASRLPIREALGSV